MLTLDKVRENVPANLTVGHDGDGFVIRDLESEFLVQIGRHESLEGIGVAVNNITEAAKRKKMGAEAYNRELRGRLGIPTSL